MPLRSGLFFFKKGKDIDKKNRGETASLRLNRISMGGSPFGSRGADECLSLEDLRMLQVSLKSDKGKEITGFLCALKADEVEEEDGEEEAKMSIQSSVQLIDEEGVSCSVV